MGLHLVVGMLKTGEMVTKLWSYLSRQNVK